MLIDEKWPESVIDSRKGSLWSMREFMLQHAPYFQLLVSRVSAALHMNPSGTYAEFGAGCGLLSLELAATGPILYTSDIGSTHFVAANAVAKHFKLQVEFMASDMQNIPLADETLDGIVAVNVFEHLADRDAALNGMIRTLKPGAWLTIEDGNLLRLRGVFDLLFLYPVRSRGKNGGVDWLSRRNKVRPLYNGMFIGRDEDWKTIWWWRRYMSRFPELCQVEVSTTRHYDEPARPYFVNLFFGGIRIVARKSDKRA